LPTFDVRSDERQQLIQQLGDSWHRTCRVFSEREPVVEDAHATNHPQEILPVAKKKTTKTKQDKKRLHEAPDGSGAAFNEQDPKRRLGNFGGAGEHPRKGSRTAGIVGQTKQRNRTDKGSKKK
jgi:hypothetical protein